MREWILKAIVCATLLAVPVWAQHGGGGGMAGGHGFSGGGGHSSGNMAVHAPAGWNGGGGWRGGSWGGRGNGWGWRGYPYRNYGYGWRYPWWGWNTAWYWYPGWGWYGGYGGYGYDSSYYGDDYDSSYQQQYPPPGYYAQPSGSTASYASQDEVARIQQEVTQLREAQARRYSDQIHTETVLVYRDGHKETIQNYAVTGNTLWIFNDTHARKVPLANLDLTATRRDNDERGVDFIVPSTP
jgi:hypothetical protein